MSEEDVVEKRLELIAKLLALNITKEGKTKTDKVMILLELGLEPEDIAVALGMGLKRVNEAIKKRQAQGQIKRNEPIRKNT